MAMIVGSVLIGVMLVAIVAPIWMYNRLVTLKERVENAWSQIDVQLKRRQDLVPNLVETARGYLEHEQETLEKVIQARQQAVDASSIEEQAQAENLLSGALGDLLAVSESYPELKADERMRDVHEELTNTENKISFARQHYNDSVLQYNRTLKIFPFNIVGDAFDFGESTFFEIEDPADRDVPEVEFSE